MTRNFSTTLHLDKVQTLHHLVMVQLAQLFTVNCKLSGSTPSANNLVKGFVFVDDHIWVHNVSNGTQFFVNLRNNVTGNLILRLNFFVVRF